VTHRKKRPLERITTTIKFHFLEQIVDGRKHTEYRDMKPYWDRRLAAVSVPFELRLINGYRLRAPEATVLIDGVRRHRRDGFYALHIARVLKVKYLP
jgi:hypothetical protein